MIILSGETTRSKYESIRLALRLALTLVRPRSDLATCLKMTIAGSIMKLISFKSSPFARDGDFTIGIIIRTGGPRQEVLNSRWPRPAGEAELGSEVFGSDTKFLILEEHRFHFFSCLGGPDQDPI